VEKCTNNPRRRGLRSDTLRTRADAQVEAPNHHTIIIEIAARAKTPRICKSPGREGCDPTDVCRDLSKKKKILSSSEKEQNDGRKSKSITISKMKLFRMSCWEEDNNNNKNDSNEIVNKKVIEGQQDY
jgi:hypothetical protein